MRLPQSTPSSKYACGASGCGSVLGRSRPPRRRTHYPQRLPKPQRLYRRRRARRTSQQAKHVRPSVPLRLGCSVACSDIYQYAAFFLPLRFTGMNRSMARGMRPTVSAVWGAEFETEFLIVFQGTGCSINARRTASGSRAITVRKARAGPVGTLRLCRFS